MPKFKISNEYISYINESKIPIYPKYTTQIINLANQNSGGTRPKNVGQLSELFPEYLADSHNPSLEEWKKWYTKRFPNAIDTAVEKIWIQVKNLKNCIQYIDKKMVRTWAEDLIYNKTFNGLYYQKAILKKIAEIEGKNYRLASPYEESINIDGYVGDIAYQIKPESYDHMNYEVRESIPCKIIKYKKISTGIEVEY